MNLGNSGNDSEHAQQYYQYIYSHYLQNIPADRTHILASGPFWIALWAAILIIFFALYAFSLNHAHRKQGEMYGASSFAGAILERIGTVSAFTIVISSMIIVYALYFIVTHILFGQVY